MYLLLLLLLGAVFAFLYFKNQRTAVGQNSIPLPQIRQVLQQYVGYYRLLSEEAKTSFETRVQAFLGRITIEGIGTEVEAADKVLVAASAIIPIFGFHDWQYRNLTNVILYPDTFNGDFQFEGGERNILGMVGSGYMNGQMILSKSSLRRGFTNVTDKQNTAIHEFVHLLDKSDGAVDGIPENLLAHEYSLPWLRMMHQEIEQIKRGKSDINPYAATNESEFLAVVAEYFFERPALLQSKHPELFAMLTHMFGAQPEATKQ